MIKLLEQVTSHVHGRSIVDFIISHDNASSSFNMPSESIQFTGRFGIVRKYKNTDDLDSLITMYIGEGSHMICEGKELSPETGTSAYVEHNSTLVSLEEKLNETISFYPNPSSTKNSLQTLTQLQVYNHIGQRIVNERNINNLDISDLKAGIYSVVMNKTTIKELVVK